ncbi:putative transcription factor C2H2 family [Helianthus annuus]|nr:putative transcription factor C2H2 family [Helianthus annuus]KAJ0770994.1 putative transcription factor C2H2 family [Helianthus annuus]
MMYHESLRVDDLSQETIGQEHSVKIGGKSDEAKEEVDICAICLQEFEMGETYMAFECKHGYHQECIEKWLQKKKNCPVCRAHVFPFLSKIFVFRVGS